MPVFKIIVNNKVVNIQTMSMRFIPLTICFLLIACSSQKKLDTDAQIIRFDTALYQYLTQNEPDGFLDEYRTFLDEYGEKIIGIGRSDSAGFYSRLREYFSESTLMQLYSDQQVLFSDISALNAELSSGMEILLKQFPELRRSKIYLHVSGWLQNVVVSDEILSLSADKYMGADYSLYPEFFYEYQRQNMLPERVAPDYLLGFLMANFPFRGNAEVLLDRMIYEGKLRYILSRLLPKRKMWEYVGYTGEQHKWCNTHRDRIWKSILDNQHLYRPDYFTTDIYLKDAPTTATLSPDSPGRVGVWIGFQIVVSYMERHPTTDWRTLMNQTDYVAFLKESRFNPKKVR